MSDSILGDIILVILASLVVSFGLWVIVSIFVMYWNNILVDAISIFRPISFWDGFWLSMFGIVIFGTKYIKRSDD